VNGRVVADLDPVDSVRRTFVARDEVAHLLARSPLDKNSLRDIDSAVGATIEEV
jgi:hypothetical protein